jgi:hypothetical protein
MKCSCGYDFAKERTKGVHHYESHVTVNDRSFLSFLNAEIKAFKCRRDSRRALPSVVNSCWRTGTLLECPKCETLTWLKEGASEVVRYQKQA